MGADEGLGRQAREEESNEDENRPTGTARERVDIENWEKNWDAKGNKDN